MCVLSPCTSTRLSSKVRMRKVGIRRLQLRYRLLKRTQGVLNTTLQSAASHHRKLNSSPGISSLYEHTVSCEATPNLALGSLSLYSNQENAQPRS